jgi:hypothetical protein
MRHKPIARAVVAALLALAGSFPAVAQDVKWRAPRLPGGAGFQPAVKSDANAAASKMPAPLAPQPVAQVPFRPPPVDSLPPPVLRSVVAPPPTMPSTLPPETIAPGPTDGFDPLGTFFSYADETLPEIEEWERNTPPLISHLVPNKPGLFQKFGLSGSWVEGGTEGRAPAIGDLSTYTTFAVPFPIREWPLYITPGADVRTLDGPAHPDLPPRLYDAYFDFTWKLRITQRSSHVISVAPGYYSDFEQSSGHAFRLTGKWVGTYDVVKHRISLMTGTIYLGRDDLKTLFMGGLVFTPNDWSRFEAVFPSPRASLRLRATESFEDWIYTGADFYGGQTYAIERADTSLDRVTLRDNRAVLGLERRRNGGAGWHLESGWVFDRDVLYHNNSSQDFSPKPTYYFHVGFTL